MVTKRLTLQETTKVLHTAVFPAIAYPAKFTALNQRQYEAIASPARQLVRTKGHYKLHHNAVVFNNDATSYGESHKDLNDYIQGNKYAIYQRMSGGDRVAQDVVKALMARTLRQLGASMEIPSSYVVETPRIEDNAVKWYSHQTRTLERRALGLYPPMNPEEAQYLKGLLEPQVATLTWGESLVQWIQQGSCNLAAYVPALAGQYVSPDGTSVESVTATPILDETELVMNEFTREDLIDFQLQYNLHYVEELFGALEDPASGDVTFTDELSVLDIIPDMFIPFVRRLQAKYRHDASITKGQMFMRPNIILELYTDSNAWHEVLHFSANRDYPSTSEEGDSSIHTVEWFVTDNTIMTNGTDLHSVQQPANPAHRRTQTRSSQRAAGIMRRLVSGPVNEREKKSP